MYYYSILRLLPMLLLLLLCIATLLRYVLQYCWCYYETISVFVYATNTVRAASAIITAMYSPRPAPVPFVPPAPRAA